MQASRSTTNSSVLPSSSPRGLPEHRARVTASSRTTSLRWHSSRATVAPGTRVFAGDDDVPFAAPDCEVPTARRLTGDVRARTVSRSGSTTRCSRTCTTGSPGPAFPIRSRAPGGSTAFHRVPPRNSSNIGVTSTTGVARRRDSTARPLPNHHRRSVDPLRPRPVRITRMRFPCCSPTVGRVRSSSSSR